jgi:hypothetical protein
MESNSKSKIEMIYSIAIFALLLVFVLIASSPSWTISKDGFVDYVVYGPGPWWYLGGPGPRGFGGGPYPRRRRFQNLRWCPYRKMWVY